MYLTLLKSVTKNKQATMTSCLAYFFFLTVAIPLNAQIYKTVDENGNVIYSDKPINEKAEKVNVSTDEPSHSEKKAAQERANQLIGSKNNLMDSIKDKKNEQQKVEKKQAKTNTKCEALKKSLKLLEKQVRLYQTTNDGERNYMSDEERQKKITEIKQALSDNCHD